MRLFTTPDGKNRFVTFAIVCSLFFLWGVCNLLLDDLNKLFKGALQLQYWQSGLIQLVWYSSYLVMAFPAGIIAKKFGYKAGILSGLFIVMLGCLLFIPACLIQAPQIIVYSIFLTVLFILATGLVFLETLANPYTTVLGSKEGAASRINLAQTCNGLGSILGPTIGALFILSTTAAASTNTQDLYKPYLIIAGAVLIMFIGFLFAPIPDIASENEERMPKGPSEKERSLFHENHFLCGIGSQFFYCIAQTGVFSLFINYTRDFTPALSQGVANFLNSLGGFAFVKDGVYHLTDQGAGTLHSLAFVFFTLGRFSGSFVVALLRPQLALATYAAINVVLMVAVVFDLGWFSWISLLLSYFFMSIMYPTNFALAIRGLGGRTTYAASGMVTAIIGAGIGTIVMGVIADMNHGNLRISFLVPMVAFAVVAAYGFFWKKLFSADMEPEEAPVYGGH